jgi:transcriptional regulator
MRGAMLSEDVSQQAAVLLERHPLAWLVYGAAGDMRVALLPLRPVFAADGALIGVRGHLPTRHPAVAVCGGNPRATILATGPHGYVSPSWLTDRTQAPTWNYAAVQIDVALTLTDDPTWIAVHLTDLVDAHERGRPARWSIAEMGPRYDRIARAVTGFNARIISIRPIMKLGQGESDADYAEIVAGLIATGDVELVEWMRAHNRDR